MKFMVAVTVEPDDLGGAYENLIEGLECASRNASWVSFETMSAWVEGVQVNPMDLEDAAADFYMRTKHGT